MEKTIKFRGCKTKVKTLGYKEFTGKDCFYSYPLIDWENRPMNSKDYKLFVKENIDKVQHWISCDDGFEPDRVCDSHSHRIYIRIIK